MTQSSEQATSTESAKVPATENLMYRWYVLGVLMIVYAFSFMDRQIVSILLEDLRAEFLLTDTQLGLLSGIAFALFYATLGVPIARYADRANRVRIVSIAITVWSLMTAVCGMAGSFWQLFLARVGVGIGEAGGGPPSHSIVSDYFDATQRSIAMSIYSMGPTVGTFIGLAAGGWVAQEYGWRWAFASVGLPGVILAAILYTTVREPVRGGMDATPPADNKDGFMATVRLLIQNRVWLWNMLGHTFAIFVGYGFSSWKPALYLRQFDLSQAEVGALLGTMGLLVGVPGLLIGGLLGDRLIARSRRLTLYCIGFATLLTIPFYGIGLMADGWLSTTILLGIGLVFYQLGYGTSISIGMSAVAPHQRALAASFGFLTANLLGLGVGPLLVGAISDAATASFGDRSLAFALGVCLITLVIAFGCFVAAARAIPAEED